MSRAGRWATAATALVVAPLLALTGCHGDSPARPTVTTVGAHTVRSDLGSALQGLVDGDTTGLYRNLGAVVVTVDGRTVYQRYRGGFTPDTAAYVDAVQTTVLGSLVGIALADGDLPGLDARLSDLLPRRLAKVPADVGGITLRQLLGMTAGLMQDDAYLAQVDGVPENDRPAWVLAHGLVAEPGERFAYSSADTLLLATVLAEATGRSVSDYAREKLFDPLGIPPGDGSTLRVPDLVTLGQLWLARGAWQGRQLIPAAWVDALSTQYVFTGTTEKFPGYGYTVWTDAAAGHPAIAAAGRGGQLVEVVPALGLVAVFVSALTPDTSALDLVGVAGATNYSDLVDLTIAPRIT